MTLDLASDDPFGIQFVYDELEKDGVGMSSLMKRSAADKRLTLSIKRALVFSLCKNKEITSFFGSEAPLHNF